MLCIIHWISKLNNLLKQIKYIIEVFNVKNYRSKYRYFDEFKY